MDKLFIAPVEVITCIRLHCYRCSDASLELSGDEDISEHGPSVESWKCNNKNCKLYPYRFGGQEVRYYDDVDEARDKLNKSQGV